MQKTAETVALLPESRQIAWVRSQLGLTQELMAKSLGVSRATLNGWETGRLVIPRAKFAHFCAVSKEQLASYREPLEYDSKGYPYGFDMNLLEEYSKLELGVIHYWVSAPTPENPKRMVLADDDDSEAYYVKVQKALDAYLEELAGMEGDEFVHRTLGRARIEKTGYKRFLNPRDNEEKRNKDIEYLKHMAARVKRRKG